MTPNGQAHPLGTDSDKTMKKKDASTKPTTLDNQKASAELRCSALFGDFNPSLRNTFGNIWEASIRLPVVGYVTTSGNGWEEAKMRLWIVFEAVKLLASKRCADPKDWTDDQWRSTLKIMRDVMSPNAP